MIDEFTLNIMKILKESFADLPDEVPYGFWILPDGEPYVVTFQNHKKVAYDIIQKSVKYKPMFDKMVDKMQFDKVAAQHYSMEFIKTFMGDYS
jgi:hypothetical protein